MKLKAAKRIICGLTLLSFLLWAPWYLVLAGIIIFNFLFPAYWEGFAAGLAMDSLYSLPGQKIYAGFGVFSLLALLAVVAGEFIRNKIRM